MTLRIFRHRLYAWLATGFRDRCRRAIAARWYALETGQIVFYCFLLGAMTFFGSFGYFAYASHLRMEQERQRNADLHCLAKNIYFEARGEPFDGQLAVAEVTLNRVDSKRFPDTVCEVVHEQRWDVRRRRYVGAFSWTELGALPRPDGAAWQRALVAAETVYDQRRDRQVEGALFYHADSIEPRWARTQKRVAKIGRHIFYE